MDRRSTAGYGAFSRSGRANPCRRVRNDEYGPLTGTFVITFSFQSVPKKLWNPESEDERLYNRCVVVFGQTVARVADMSVCSSRDDYPDLSMTCVACVAIELLWSGNSRGIDS